MTASAAPCVTVSTSQPAPAIPPVIDAHHLADLLTSRPDVRLLDVRTPGEFASVHIRGSYNVPLDTLGEHGPEIRASVDAPIVLVCQSGRRARRAEEALRRLGLPQLHVLDGGLDAWLAAGYPARRGPSRLPLERQVRIAAGALAASGGALALTASPLFAAIPTFVGAGLLFAGVTDTCAMAMLLARLPYNRPAACDIGAAVRELARGGAAPAGDSATVHRGGGA